MSHECRCGEVDLAPVNERSSPFPMVSVRDALSQVLHAIDTLADDKHAMKHVFVKREESIGYTVAQTRHATEPFPPFPASTMDGYAIVSSDGVGTFDVVSSVTAGHSSPNTAASFRLKPGQIAYITTGAPVPEGADAVVPVEWSTLPDAAHPARVQITQSVEPGTNIRPIGCDITVGQTILHAGQRIGPAEVGIMASVGIDEVLVVDRPIVGVLSSGDEVVDANTAEPAFGEIRDSNRPMLLALFRACGAKVLDLGHVTDVASKLEEKVLDGLEKVDMFVMSGGVSMGALDLVKPLLSKIGQIHFGRLNMKPGKPTTFATVPVKGSPDGLFKLVFALPGNPVSALVTSQLLVVPAIRAWRCGSSEGITPDNHGYPILPVEVVTPLKQDPTRPEYHRLHVSYDGARQKFIGRSTGSQMSSRLLSVCACNGMTIVPKGTGEIAAGTTVQTLIVADLNMPYFPPPAVRKLSGSSSAHAPPLPPGRDAHLPHAAASASPGAATTPSSASSATSSSSARAPFQVRASVLTVSDRCSRGESTDLSGPAVANFLTSSSLPTAAFNVLSTALVPDDMEAIGAQIKQWTDESDPHPHVIITTGGTGFAPRDITPEAVRTVLERQASGFVHAMMQASLAATPMGALARPVAGTRKRTIILTLPGSPKAIPEILTPIIKLLPHAVKLLQGTQDAHPNKQ